MSVTLSKSKIYPYKFTAVVVKNGRKKTIHFGNRLYEDYTTHKDPERKRLYLIRHKSTESWRDIFTKGFWSRHLLWEKTSLASATKHIESNFGIKIIWQ